jgi:hypothetical protein
VVPDGRDRGRGDAGERDGERAIGPAGRRRADVAEEAGARLT